jgi:cell division protein FtsQ
MRVSRKPLRGSVTQKVPLRLRAKSQTYVERLARAGALAGSVLVIAGLTFWLWHIGWPQREVERLADVGLHVTQKARFAVKDIVVEGRKQVNKDDLISALGTISGAPIFDFDPRKAQARVSALPWVASAIVERRLPDTIFVHLTERTPLARWQHDGHTVVIDSSGIALPEASLDQYSQLPLVVGADAAGHAEDLLMMLKDFPPVAEKMTAAVRAGERRWDIHLQPNIVARLPEKDMIHALSRLSDLITDQKILERNIVAIDLRDPTKMILEPGGNPSPSQSAGDTHL